MLDPDEGGSDAESGKTTVLSFMSKEDARSLALALTQGAVEAIRHYNGSEALVELAVWLAGRSA